MCEVRREGEEEAYHEEDLLQSLNADLIPAGVEVDASSLTADQVLSQHHYKPLGGGGVEESECKCSRNKFSALSSLVNSDQPER